MKYGAGGQRSLITAGFALIQVTDAMKIGDSMTTTRALEAFRPSHPKQLLLTGFFGTKLFLKLHQAEWFLLHALAPIRYIF